MIVLTRSDPDLNMHRFYALDVAPTLFGGWVVVREWGRIGQSGTIRTDHLDSEASWSGGYKTGLVRSLPRC